MIYDVMNRHPPMTENSNRKGGYSFHEEIKGIAEQIMKEACNEVCSVSRIIEKGNESVVHTDLPVDGT